MLIATIWVGRPFCRDYFLESLHRLKTPENTKFLVIDASPDRTFEVQPWMTRKFKEVIVEKGNPAPSMDESKRTEKFDNIRDNYNVMSKVSAEIDSDYILTFEDDMSVPSYGLERLLSSVNRDKFGFICAWSNHKSYYPDAVGRPTVWRFIDSNTDKHSAKMGDKIKLETVMPPKEWRVVEEIDACGLAFTLFKKELFDNHEFVTEKEGLYGVDITLCYTIRQKGYKGYVDWSIKTSHYELVDGEVVVW